MTKLVAKQDKYHSDIAEILNREHERIRKKKNIEHGGMVHPLCYQQMSMFHILEGHIDSSPVIMY